MAFTFDPYGFAEKILGRSTADRLIRLASALGCLGFVALRLREYDDFLVKPLWAAETLTFLVVALAYLTRVPPVDRSKGFSEVALPLLATFTPFLLLFTPPHPFAYATMERLQALFWGMALSTTFTVWGLFTLGRSFSITVEARKLVAHGPYRLVRHPVYLGEMAAALFVTLWRFSLLNLAVFAIFSSLQLYRSYLEERKLKANFQDFGERLSRSWWFFQ